MYIYMYIYKSASVYPTQKKKNPRYALFKKKKTITQIQPNLLPKSRSLASIILITAGLLDTIPDPFDQAIRDIQEALSHPGPPIVVDGPCKLNTPLSHCVPQLTRVFDDLFGDLVLALKVQGTTQKHQEVGPEDLQG